MTKYFEKIKNYTFWTTVLLLIYITISNIFLASVHSTGVTQAGTQVGGRMTSISPLGCQLPPPTGTGPDPICVAVGCIPNPSNNGIIIVPYGYSATGLCLPVATQTTEGPITAQASTGKVILGLFQTPVIPTVSIPIGIIGTASQ